MKIISWNVNSVRARIANITEYIKVSKPDVLCLQEIKTEDKNLETNFHNKVKNQLKNTDQIKTNPITKLGNENEKSKVKITSFKELIDLANKEKEIELKYDLERNVKLVSFNKGKIDISFNEKLNKNFIKNLTDE